MPDQACKKGQEFSKQNTSKTPFLCKGTFLKTLLCTSAVDTRGNIARVLIFGTSHTAERTFS